MNQAIIGILLIHGKSKDSRRKIFHCRNEPFVVDHILLSKHFQLIIQKSNNLFYEIENYISIISRYFRHDFFYILQERT